jgi:hypothetical protein
MKEITIRPNKFSKQPHRDRGRAVLARHFLLELLVQAKSQVDLVTWINKGGLDAEEFIECLDTGRPHPLLQQWRNLKATSAAHRQPPTSRELRARRLIVLALIALERTVSIDKLEARKEVAKAAAHVFDPSPSHEAIHHWHRDLNPPLTPGDERVLATAVTRARDDRKALIDYFVGLAYAVMAPVPIADVQ